MEVINGEWIMRGLSLRDPKRVKTYKELVERIKEAGFLPLFSNEVDGFSVEEQVAVSYWWSGDREHDPWEWREIIASEREVAYGKFFGGKAGFISLEWLPVFANYRRLGYDFDSRWEDGLATRREKLVMDKLIDRDESGEPVWSEKQILTTDLKRLCGFGKGGEKNFPGIITGLMMQTYLTIVGFRRRVNKRGEEYGMAVSIMQPPEAVWGYDLISSCYGEEPRDSWRRIADHVKALYPGSDEESIIKLIGKEPKEL